MEKPNLKDNKELGINKIELSDVKNDPKGRCVDCFEFIPDDENMKHCHCKQKKGYVTMNALRKLACKEYREMIRPKFHDYLATLGYNTKDILEAMKTAKKEFTKSDMLVLEVRTRAILETNKEVI